jgi:hypothetical protein
MLWIYDPATDQRDAAQAALPPQSEHLTVTADSKRYVAGGRWAESGNLAAFEIYDSVAGAWTR